MSKMSLVYAAALVTLASTPAFAEDYVLTIKDHQFSPTELVVPVDQKLKITVKNKDDSSEEFESSDLNREKTVDANSEITIFVGPLKAGSYKFYGDDHHDTAKGIITAK